MKEVVSIPPFAIDLANEVIHRDGREIRVRRKTFLLLRYLIENRGRLLTKDDILDHVWPETHVGDAVLKVTISQLRKIFRECCGFEIATVHGRGYRLRLEDDRAEQTAASATGGPRPLVGRGAIQQQLRDAFAAALAGQRQLIFVGGAPGVGKSAVVDSFVSELDSVSDLLGTGSSTWIGQSRCLPVPGAEEPLRPVFQALAAVQSRPAREALAGLLARFAPHLLEDATAAVDAGPSLTAPESLQQIVLQEIERHAAVHPLVLVLEDLHWSDVQTCSLLAALFRRAEQAHLLVVVTYRPAEVASRSHSLATVLHELPIAHPANVRVLDLEPLDADAIAAWVERDLGSAQPELSDFLFERSRGNPLFVDRLLRHLQSAGALRREAAGWYFDARRVQSSSVPEELEHFIAAQLDQLDRQARRIVQAASVAGASFMTQDIAAILGLAPAQVEAVCDDLAHKHQLLDMLAVKSRADGVVGTEYQFRHPLFQQVLYDRLPAVCRQDFHARLAAQLERSYGESAVLNAHALAHHFGRGGVPERTAHYLRVAAHVAVRRGMLSDARAHFNEVMRILETAPPSGGEIDVATEMARLMVICSGPTPETSAAVGRVLELQQTSPAAEPQAGLIPTFMLFALHVVEGDFHKAHAVARALHDSTPEVSPEAHAALGLALYGMHEPAAANAELLQAIRGAAPVHGLTVDHVMLAHAVLALSYFQIGDLIHAGEHRDMALQRARASEAPVNHAVGLGFVTELHLLTGEWEWASRLAVETLAVSAKHDMRTFAGQAAFVKGWAAFESGRFEEGLERMAAGLQTCESTAHGLGLPYLLALYGNAQASRGEHDAGLASIARALARAEQSGERRAEAEIHRLKAGIVLRSRRRHEQRRAVEALLTALDCARTHGSHLFQLRAAIDLARCAGQSDRARARQALEQALAAIDPALEARELRAGRDLLRQLR